MTTIINDDQKELSDAYTALEALAGQYILPILTTIMKGAELEGDQLRAASPAFPGHAGHNRNLCFNVRRRCWRDFSIDRGGNGIISLAGYVLGLDMHEAAEVVCRLAVAADRAAVQGHRA